METSEELTTYDIANTYNIAMPYIASTYDFAITYNVANTYDFAQSSSTVQLHIAHLNNKMHNYAQCKKKRKYLR